MVKYKIKIYCIFFFIMLLLLTGCSFIKLGYNYADWYMINKLDDLFDLNRAQETFAEENIERFHKWHRQNELPRYASFLREVHKTIDNGVTEPKLRQFYVTFDQLIDNSSIEVIPFVSELLTKLSDEQIAHLEKELQKGNDKIREGLALSKEEITEKRLKRIRDSYEDWIGDLSDEQLQIIEDFVHRVPNYNEYRLPKRLKEQKLFIDSIRQNNTVGSNQSVLMDIWVHSKNDTTKEHVKKRNSYRNENIKLWLSMYGTLDKEQKKHLLDKMEDIIEDLEALSKR